MTLEQDDVTRICTGVVDHEMDTALVPEQFEVSRRRIQQLAKEYRETGEIPTLKQRGRSPYAEYLPGLEEHILYLAEKHDQGAEVIAHMLRSQSGGGTACRTDRSDRCRAKSRSAVSSHG